MPRLIAATGLGLVLALAGCGEGNDQTAETPITAPEPQVEAGLPSCATRPTA